MATLPPLPSSWLFDEMVGLAKQKKSEGRESSEMSLPEQLHRMRDAESCGIPEV